MQRPPVPLSLFFFFNDTATTEIYTLSLHDALPISRAVVDLSGRSYADVTLDLSRETIGGLACENIPHVLRSLARSEEHTSELQSQSNLVCRLLLEKKKNKK